MKLARDLMQRNIISIDGAASLLDAHRLFVEEEISGAPVVDEDGRVIGVLSARDLLRALDEERDTAVVDTHYFRDLTEFSGPDWGSMPEDFQDRMQELTAGDAMTREIVAVDPDETVYDVARTMLDHHVHRVLVLDAGVLRGVISAFDLLRAFARLPPAELHAGR